MPAARGWGEPSAPYLVPPSEKTRGVDIGVSLVFIVGHLDMIPDTVIHHGAAVAAPKTFCGGGVPPFLARRSASSLRHYRNHRPSRARRGRGFSPPPNGESARSGVVSVAAHPRLRLLESSSEWSGSVRSARLHFQGNRITSGVSVVASPFREDSSVTVATPLQKKKIPLSVRLPGL